MNRITASTLILATAVACLIAGPATAGCDDLDTGTYTIVIDGNAAYPESGVQISLTNPSANLSAVNYTIRAMDLQPTSPILGECTYIERHGSESECVQPVGYLALMPGETDVFTIAPIVTGLRMRIEISYAQPGMRSPLLVDALFLAGGYGAPVTAISHEFVPRDECR